MRVDRWLWCARFFKTRSLAATAVKRGKIRVNGDRPKPGRLLVVGDELSIDRGPFVTDVEVLKMPVRRGPAAEAATLYLESEESSRRRESAVASMRSSPRLRAPTEGRPDKRTRRLMRGQRREPG